MGSPLLSCLGDDTGKRSHVLGMFAYVVFHHLVARDEDREEILLSCGRVGRMVEPSAPVLEMLWESHDPRYALDSRFGFSDGASVGRWVAAVLDRAWGVQISSCERVVISGYNALAWARTSSGRLIAKWSVLPDCYNGLLEIARLTHWLDGQGLPVSAPIPTLDGSLQVELDGTSMNLQREIEGELLDVTDSGQVRSAGTVLARLQDALAAYPDADRLVALADPPPPLRIRITDWLDSDAKHLPAAADDTLRQLLTAVPHDEPPTQLGHHDIRSANVICANAEVAAVLDFEGLTLDHRIVELARSAVMLGTRFRNWGPVPANVRTEFLAGYQSVRRLTAIEADWWAIVLLWQALAIVPPGDDPTGWGRSALAYLAEVTT